jgi:integrase
MAKRFQHGSLQRLQRGGRLVWMGFWYDAAGQRHSKTLGTVADLTKTDAREKLDALVRPVNEQRRVTAYTFGTFVKDVVLPAKRRYWKASSRMTTEDRIERTLIPAFQDRELTSLTRGMLQDFLDRLAADGTAWSIIAHTRWDLSMIMKFAHNEGHINRNPAALLHIPDAPRRERHVLTIQQAKLVFTSFGVRERLILKLCGLAGLRPGEALAAKWSDVSEKGLRIQRRVYRGVIDTPKSTKGNRIAALSKSLREDLREWHATTAHPAPEDWIFASENSKTPLWPTNVWHDKIRPTLDTLGLSWVNYQVLRRSAASLLNQLGVEGKTVADQLGHALDVSQNVYTQAGLDQQRRAIEKLDNALRS